MIQDSEEQAKRLDVLEEYAAHQAQIIDELSEQISQQWTTIETLRRKQKQLTDRLFALEEQSGEAPAITKPPHY